MSKKLIFVNRFFYPDHSATSQLLGDLCFDLAGDGFDVSVITSRLRYHEGASPLPPREVIRGVKIHRVASTSFGRERLAGRSMDYLTFYACAILAMWRCTDRSTILVCKTDPPLLSIVAVLVARLRGAQVVNWLQDLFPEVVTLLGAGFGRRPMLRALTAARNASLAASGMNVVPGERMALHLRKEGIPADRIRVMPNWADGLQVRPVPHAVNPLRAEWGLDGRFVVAYSGNFGRAHEFRTILDAADRLKARPGILFLFIGGGAQHAFIAEEVRKRRLDNVRFRPYQPRERLSQSLSAGDVHLVCLHPEMEGFVVPSKYYGVAAAGRPTLFVGDPDGEISRVLKRSGGGVSVPVGDSDGLRATIELLSERPDLCQELGARARTFFEAHFERKIAVSGWKQLLGGLSRSGARDAATEVESALPRSD